MFVVARKENLANHTFLWDVEAPDVAAVAQPGQFIMVRLKKEGERIPLTVADFDRERGTVTLVVKVVGKTTEEMSTYNEGDEFLDFIGPLGCASHIDKKDHVVLVGGGLGVAPLYPILRGFKEAGVMTTMIIGFRKEAEIFWHDRFRKMSDRLIEMTEDGSVGEKGNVVDGLRKVIEESHVDEVLTIGSLPMMEAVAELTRPLKIQTWASMNPIMVDGIGMCGSCRVTVDGKVLFACVDGPDMDAHKVNFEELKIRQKRFAKEENDALKHYHQECKLREVSGD